MDVMVELQGPRDAALEELTARMEHAWRQRDERLDAISADLAAVAQGVRTLLKQGKYAR